MKTITTLGNIAQFSKFLNTIAPLKQAKPKNWFGQGRELVHKINNAGEEVVWRTGNRTEGLFHVNKSGKASAYSTKGMLDEVDHLYKDIPKIKNYTVHNHPQNSSLSSADLYNNYNPKSQIIAVDTYGSKYRAYPKSQEAHEAVRHLLDSTTLQEKLMKKNLISMDLPTQQERALAYTHYRNKALKKLGLIHYSAQIKNPAFTDNVKKEGKKIENYFYKNYRKIYSDYLPKERIEIPQEIIYK